MMTAEQKLTAVDMTKKGFKPSQIAAVIGVAPIAVRNCVGFARRDGVLPPVQSQHHRGIRLHLSQPVSDLLARSAQARGWEPRALGRLIVERVLSDDLIDAVLDEEVHHE